MIDPINNITSRKRFEEVPEDILIPAKLNAIDQGRYVVKSPFTARGRGTMAGPANYAQSVVETVERAIQEGRISLSGFNGANLTLIGDETGQDNPDDLAPQNPPEDSVAGNIYIEVFDDSIVFWSYDGDSWVNVVSIPTNFTVDDLLFDSNRPILREYSVGVNIGGTTVRDFLEYPYFSSPVISFSLDPTTTVYEVGTSNLITLEGSVSNPGTATLTNGSLRRTNPGPTTEILAFADAEVFTTDITFTPQQGGTGIYNELTYSFNVVQDWEKGAESGTDTSTTRTITGVYPVLYGVATTDTATVFADLYGTLNKLVQAQGNKTVNFNGTGLMYYAFPQTWSDLNLSAIFDGNGFNVTASFTRVTTETVSSAGLVNDYVAIPYVVYYLNTGATTVNANYTFNL